MTYEEFVKKASERKKEKEGSGEDYKSKAKRRYFQTNVANDIVNRTNAWLTSTGELIDGHNERYKDGNKSYRIDTEDYFSSVSGKKNEFDAEADSILALLDKYKGYYDEEWGKKIRGYLSADAADAEDPEKGNNRTSYNSVYDRAQYDRDFFAEFENEDAYNKWLKESEAQERTREGYRKYDATAGAAEIERIKGFATRAKTINEEIAKLQREIDSRWDEGLDAPLEKAALEKLMIEKYRLSQEYRGEDFLVPERGGSAVLSPGAEKSTQGKITISEPSLPFYYDTVDFDASLTEKEQYHNLATEWQRESELYSGDLDEFERFASIGNELPIDSVGKETTEYLGFGVDSTPVQNPDALRLAATALAMHNGQDGGMWKHRVEVDKYLKGLENEEFERLAYYIGKDQTEGTDTAYEYVKLLDKVINQREGDEIAEWLEPHPVLSALYGIPVGLDQFASGAAGLLTDEKLTPSATAYAGSQVRENLGTFGKGAFDVLSTTSNMLPSILVSAAVGTVSKTAGTVVGTTLLGASAAGNAKQEMLQLGYSKDQANAYGLMVGASEAGLQYVLGGIGKLGGISGKLAKAVSKIDNALARVALTLGGNMLSEGFEEGLQTVIEPWMKEAVTGLDFDAPDIDEVLYSSLLGAISSLGFEGGGMAINAGVNAYNTAQTGKSFQTKLNEKGGSIDRVVSDILGNEGSDGLAENTAAYKQAQKIQAKLDKGKRAGNYAVGKLLSKLSDSQMSSAIQSRLGENSRAAAEAITGIAKGRDVSNKALRSVMENEDAIAILNETLGTSLTRENSLSDVRKAISEATEGKGEQKGTAANFTAVRDKAMKSLTVNIDALDAEGYADTIASIVTGEKVSDGDIKAILGNKYARNALNKQLGVSSSAKLTASSTVSDVRIAVSAQISKSDNVSPARFSMEKVGDAYAVVAEAEGERGVISLYKSQKQAQAAVYAMTLGMGSEGSSGFIRISEDLSRGASLGDAAQAFNAIYRQGKQGKALSAVQFGDALTAEQRQYAYQAGIVDGMLDSSRAKSAAAEISGENSGKVLQKDGGSGTIETTQSRRENSNGKQNKSGLLSRDPLSDREGYSEISSESKRTSGDIDSRRIHRESGKIRVLSKDSEGRSIKPDTLSKISQTAVADVEGNPIPLYHATDKSFDKFAIGDIGFHFGNKTQADTRASAKNIANPRYINAYLNIKNPLRVNSDYMNWHANSVALNLWNEGLISDAEMKEVVSLWPQGKNYDSPAAVKLREILESKGYDGIAYPNGFEGDGTSYIAFHDEQIIRADNEDTSSEVSKDQSADIQKSDSRRAAEYRLEEIKRDAAELGIDFDYQIMLAQIEQRGEAAYKTPFGEVYRIIRKSNGKYIAAVEGEGSGFVQNALTVECNTFDEAYLAIDEYFMERNDTGRENILKEHEGTVTAGESSALDVQQAKSDRASSSEWSAERIKDGKAEKAKPISEIIEQIRHDFGINITKGHVRGKGVLGQYSRKNHGIRTKIANDLPTVAHELGHALDQRYGLTDKSKLTKEMRSELINALGDLKDSYKQNLWVSEGFAEYIRRFLQNRDEAARSYPEFTKHFLNSLSKADRVLMDTFADEINAYYALDADTATSSIRLREEGTPDARTPLEKAREMGDDIYQAWVDANHGIRLFDEATGASTYKLASNAAYSDAIAGQIITGELTDANGQYVAPGLKAALEGVNIGDKKIYREFGEYLVLKHGPERLAEGMQIFADPRKNNASFMDKRVAEIENAHPEFKEAADRLYEFQKQFLKTWAVDTGLIPSEIAEAWAKRWSFYVPLNRAVGKAGRIGAKRGYANQNSTVKKAIGSGLDIVHPVDNIINNIVKMVNAGVRNNVMLAITSYAEMVGADAALLEKIPAIMKKKTTDMTGVKSKLQEAFKSAGIEELLAEVERESKESEVAHRKSFSEQIDDVVSGKHNPVYDLYVGKTPDVLIDLGFENKPLLMRNSKIKEILSKHDEMSIELIKQIPDAVADPVMILKSKTNPNDSVVVITDILTAKGHMIIPVWVSQDGTYLDVEIGKSVKLDTNFVATAYGRNVKGLIEYALKNNEVLFYAEDKKRVSSLLATHGLQLPARLSISNSTISISHKNENVNKKFSTNSENAKSDAWSKVDEIIESTIDDVLVQYGQGKAHGDVVTVLRNGKQEFWKINDALLLESLTSMSQKKMNGIMEAYAVVSRFMTSNITGNNIIWSIFSNFPRDLMTFFTYSKQKNPLKAFPAMGEAYLNKVTGGKVDTKNLPYIKEYYALGGGQTSAYTADVDLAKRARKKIKNSTKLQSAVYYANPLNLLSFVSETVESGPRIATYIMMREQGMSPQEAFYESQDITVNFKRGGRLSREFNKAVPFFNASVQGLDKFRRWITCADVPKATRAKAIVGRVTVYVAVSAALGALFYALNNWDDEDEENYRLLSNYTKNTYWNIPLGDGKYFAIPKPREIAVLSTFCETTCEYFGGNDYAYNEFGEYVADNFLPPFLSDFVTDGMDGALGSLGMIGVASDLKANKDFLGRPIESAALESYESQDRYTRRTSMIAYWLGQAAAELGLEWSPVQIDYFFSQTLGGYWKVQKALFPVGSENVDWTLGVQNTYVKDNLYSNDIVNWLYDEADASSKAKTSHPDDINIAIDAKLDGNMKTFYSRYYDLTKGQKEDSASRRAKRAVLDMIIEYRKVTDNGDRSAAEKAVYDIVASCGDTSLLPAVMQSIVKDSEGNEIKLSDAQYVEYQTHYNSLYWDYIESNFVGEKSDSEKSVVIKQAQSVAKQRATDAALKSAGARSSGYFDKYSGIEDKDLVTFKTQLDLSDDEDGGTSQEEVIAIIEQMVKDGLSKEDAYTLFHSRWDSDKNNPWRRYAP